ncbi:Ig-like domain-containing protein [Pseudoduganella sp. LjRoot289]|uniref:Ig-like domain-containing protein n=1 Tax=Pseudoduganella sp. LjRoot289 TaxID=3342314 RepID=UPI003ECC4F57
MARRSRTARNSNHVHRRSGISALMVRLLSRIGGWIWRDWRRLGMAARSWLGERLAQARRARPAPAAGSAPAPFGSPFSSPFSFEAIEPRVLLSGDLSFGTASFAPAGAAPGGAASATIQLLKQGDDALGDAVRVKVYASPDGQLDGTDRLLGQFDVPPAQFGAGGAAQIQIPLDTGAVELPGNYRLIAVADSENSYAETDEGNNTAVMPGTLALAGVAGETPDGIIPAITLTDADGTRFTLSISGKGTVAVAGGAGGYTLQVTGSDAATQLALTAAGGDGRVLLAGVTVAGSIKSISGAGADLAGALTVSGALRTLVLRDAAGAQISTSGSGLLDITARNFSGVQLQTTQVADVVKFNAWTGSAGAPSSFKAAGLNNLTAAQQFTADLVLSGVGAGPLVLGNFKAGGSVGAGLWSIGGRAGNIAFGSSEAGWHANVKGALSQLAVSGNLSGLLAVASLQMLQVSGSAVGFTLLAGADLGSDAALGGTGPAADKFGAGTVARIRISGAVTGSAFLIGADPVNGVFGDGDDAQLGTATNKLQELYIGGALDAASRLVAPAFPATVNVNGAVVAPASLPQLSSVPRDTAAPLLTAALSVDTGASTSDGITSNPAVSGTAIDLKGTTALFAVLDPAGAALPSVDLSASLQANGAFTVSAAQLAVLAGGALAQGAHTLRLQARDAAGNLSQPVDVAFTFDSLPPAVTAFDLDAASDTGVAGDHSTTAATVTLAGVALTAVSVKLLGPDTVLAVGADGKFEFAGLALALGVNSFTVAATDAAGNTSQHMLEITRTGTGSGTAPSLSAALLHDTGSSSIDGLTNDPAVHGVAGGTVKAARLLATLDPDGSALPLTDVSASLAADGSYTISAAQMAALAGGALADGAHVLRLQAVDADGNKSELVDVSFTLDRAAPATFSYALSAADASNADLTTATSARVQIKGQAEEGATVALSSQGLSAVAGAGGVFILPNVTLAMGENLITLTATDAAGNASSLARTFTRVAQLQQDAVLTWNNIALKAIQLDVSDPAIATRVLAIQSLAVYDTLAAIEGTPAYLVQRNVTGPLSAEAAVAEAAYRVLYQLYPGQRAIFDTALAASLALITDGAAKDAGVALGKSIAEDVLAVRANDGYLDFAADDGSSELGKWRPTGPAYLVAQLPQWGEVTPFALASGSEFRSGPPPALDSAEYAAALEQTRLIGGATGSTRTADQTQQAHFWADGGGSITPPGHWNQIAAQVAAAEGNSLSANARLMAQLNVALADAAIACWDVKYTYDAWRPVTAIQEAGQDGNAATTQDDNWQPLLITPPHPEYVSGHSTFSAAAAGILTAAFGDNVNFSATSSTLPGVTRSFASFDQAAQEAGESRIYGGIHFEFSNQAGMALGKNVATAVLSRFALTEDKQAPSVVLGDSKAASNANLTLTGQVLDNLSGVASAQYRVDGGALQTLDFDGTGKFSLTTALALDGSADGAHTITLLARDAAGNLSAAYTRDFTLDTKAPALALASIANGDALNAASRLSGSADPTGSALVSLNYSIDGGASKSLTFDPATGTFDQALPLGELAIGDHTLMLKTQDAAGNISTLSRSISVAQLTPFAVSKVTPADGSGDVGTTFRPQVYFSRAVNPATLTAQTFYATGPDGSKLDAIIVPALDGSFAWLFFNAPMPGGSTVTLHLNGAGIRAAQDGSFLDADGDGASGGDLAWSFTTVSTTTIAGTKLVGKVVDPGADLQPMTFDDIRRGADGVIHTPDDVFLLPIANARVFIVGRPDLSTYTDADGNFSFDGVPVGDVKVGIDGRSATNPPAGVFFPEMVMDVELRPGITNTLMGSMGSLDAQQANADRAEVYLPRVQTSSLQQVSNSTPTTITVDEKSAPALTDEQRNELTLTVQPGSAVGFDGQVLDNVKIGINTVPPALVKDMLPPGVMQHTFDITIQAPGVDTFAEPVQITFPNVFNAAPGTKLNILSFDHTTGRLVINGTATVSADGKTVVSDEGSGILAPGWHGMTPPGGPSDPPCDPTVPKDKEVPPVPLVSGVQDYLFKDDAGTFTISVGNNAAKLDPSKDACDPVNEHATPLVVKITVEGNTGSGEFLTGLMPALVFSLAPQQIKNIKVDMKALLTAANLDAALADILYGARIKIEGYKSDSSGAASGGDLINKQMFVYRFFDAADNKHDDGQVDFIKTLADGLGKVYNDIPYLEEIPASAKPTYAMASSGAPTGTNFEVHTSALRFDPFQITGDRNDTIQIKTPEGKSAGTLATHGVATAPQVVKFSKAEFLASLTTVVDDPIGTMNKFLSILPPVASPGDKPSTAPGFAAFANTLYTDVVKAVYADFATVDPLTASALTLADTTAGDGIPVQWANTYRTLFGLVTVNPLGGTTAANAKWADFSNTLFQQDVTNEGSMSWLQSAYSFSSYTNRAPSDYLNVNLNQLANNNDIYSPQTTTLAGFSQLLGNILTHEIGHDLGAIHYRGLAPADTYVWGSIMGYDANLDTVASFGPSFGAIVNYSLGLPVAQGVFNSTYGYYKTYAQLDTYYAFDNAPSPRHGDQHDIEDFADLRVFAQPFMPGDPAPDEVLSVDFGRTVADGAHGQLASKTLYLVSDGTAPVTINSIHITGASGPFTVSLSGTLPITLDEHDFTEAGTGFATQIITVSYDPATVGMDSAVLQIDSNVNDGLTPLKIALRGTGAYAGAAVALDVPNNNLGGQSLTGGTKTASNFATIRNDGSEALTITQVRVSNGAGNFSIVNLPTVDAAHPLVLNAGASRTFDMSFTPSQLGLQRGTLEIVSDDPRTPVKSIGLVGTGVGELTKTLQYHDNYVALESLDTPGLPMRTISDSAGHWSFFLPPNERVHYVIFDAASGLVSHGYDLTSPSGQKTELIGGTFQASTAPDSDGDGLPDDIEFAIGSSLNSKDTNKDGLDDFASIQQGVNPLGNLAVPTGVLAAVNLQGTAEAVAVAGSANDPGQLTAYVATGNQGLAIVDASKFTKPSLLAELDLPGNNTDVAVDAARNLVAVAAGDAGLHLVDVSTPTAPALRQTITFTSPVTHVEVRDGIAYVTAGEAVATVDLNTGEIRATLDLGALGGSTLTDLAFDGNTLYTMDANRILRAITVAGDLLTPRGAITLANGGGKLFVGGGVAYIAGQSGFQQGYSTVNVSNPASLVLLSNPDATNIANAAIVANGSGLAVSVGVLPAIGNVVHVVDVSDPARTDRFITQYALPAAPRDVALANGLAFVADGTGGLQVVNFVGFDTQGVAPAVSIAVDAVDVDPAKPGIQVLEGRTVSVRPTVGDDVQVRNVELLVNGTVVSDDASFPWEITAQAPSIANGGSTLTLQVRATDTGGNATLSQLITLDVVPDTFPPVLAAINLEEGARRFFVRSVDLSFDEPLDPARLDAGGVTMVRAGADGQFGTADDVAIAVHLDTRNFSQRLSILTDTFLSPGSYRLRIDPSIIADRAGNELAAPIVRNFTVRPASDIRAATGVPEIPTAPSANPGQQIGVAVPFDPATAKLQVTVGDSNGGTSQQVVGVTRWDAATGTAWFNLPANAVSGDAVVYGMVGSVRTDFADGTFPLQIVPVVTGVEVQSVSADGSSATLILRGSGFVEGHDSEYRFGSGAGAVVVADPGNGTGPDVQQVYDPYYAQYINGQVYLTVPLANGAFGPISVKTAGGVSASFTASLGAVVATALSGTPADPAKASANAGQAVKLTGSGLSTDSDVLLRYTGIDGAPAMLRLSPVSASADGSEATLLLPAEANGVFALQMFGSASQPLLQIVPTLSRIDGTSTLYGSGFVEGATSYTLPGGTVSDTAVAAGIDVGYYYDAQRGIYVYNGAASFGSALPVHFGFGSASVTTAGGTSVTLPVTAMRPGTATAAVGAIADVAVDPASGALWTLDQDNPGHLLRIDPANGLVLQSIALTPAFGNQYTANYAGLQIAAQATSLAGTAVPAGSLLLFSGYPYNGGNSVAAINPATGALIAKLVLPVNYYATAGVVDPVSGHLFLLSHQFNQMVELNAATGAEIARVNVPFNVQSYAGMALDPVDGNFWIGSYGNIGELVKVNRAGVELRRADISGQGLNSNQITGLAFAPDGSLRIATIAGLIHRATLGDDFSVKAPTLTGLAGSALQGTPAQATVASANVGQVVELAGSNFGPGTQVLFNVRDNAGVLSVLAVRPQLINAAGTRLQVLVPDQAASGDVRVSNIGTANAGFGSQNDAVHRALTFTFTAAGATSTVRFADGGLEAIDNESWGLDNVVVRNGATVVFADDFEGGASAAWSDPLVNSNSAQSLSAFSGRFNNGSQTLSLAGLTAGQSYTVSFDLYALDTWDGSAGNPDQLSVAVDGTTVFSRTISNSLLSAQTVNATPGIRLQVVPTLAAVVGRPGQDDLFTLQGSGYMEGATTVTVGGIAVTDPGSNTYPFDVSGARNDSVNVVAPRTLDGPIRITTDGGYAELAGAQLPQQAQVAFTGIAASASAGLAADPAHPSANTGQYIVLSGQGLSSATLVQFQALDDSGKPGTVTVGGSPSGDGKTLTVRVPVLARSGAVAVLGSNASFDLQVVPVLRGVGGTVTPGQTLLIEGTGLVASELAIQVDGRGVGAFEVDTINAGTSAGYGDQQLLRLTVPAGAGAGVITVSTAGGSATIRSGASLITALPDATPADAGATLATSIAAAVGLNQSLALKAALADGTDIDLYRIDLAAGDQLVAYLSSNPYSHLRLFDAAGAELRAGYRAAGDATPLNITAPAAGSYYVGVSAYYNSSYNPNVAGSGNNGSFSGNYTLNLTRLPAGATRIAGIAAVAASGTPAQAALASANTLQTITLNGSGLLAGDQVVFSILDDYGQLSETTVAPASVASDGNSLTVAVPMSATTGTVRLARDAAGVVLQIVPTLTGVEANNGNQYNGGPLRLTGSGYAEGSTAVLFGALRLDDISRNYGLDVNDSGRALNLTVPDGAPSGPIRVRTIGGTSAAFSLRLTGISATAASGTGAVPGQASAIPGQLVTLSGVGMTAATSFAFRTLDANGTAGEIIVRPTLLNADGTQAQVRVPAAAVTGDVRMVGDISGTLLPLQIIPVVTGVEVQSVSADGSSAVLILRGSGFVEGNNSEYRFGSGGTAQVIVDAGAALGPDVQQVYDPAVGQYTSGQVYLTVPLSNGAFGPISVKTAGGVSASFTASLGAVVATALSGTPADPAKASANAGQAVKLTGSGLSTDSDVLLRYTGIDGAPAMLRLSPVSASADGSEATLLLPAEANGVFALQMFGSASQPLLQIVPTLSRIDGTSTLYGSGFVEGATSYALPGGTISDTAVAAGIDVGYYYDAQRGIYVYNGAASFGSALPVHFGFGSASVTTAGGTSVTLPVNAMRPGTATAAVGAIADVAVDLASGALWTLDQDNPGHLLRIDPANGLVLQSIALTPAFGNQYTANYAGLQIAAQATSLAGTAVPAGSLLLFSGYPYNGGNSVAAINPATGALIAKLVLPVNYYATAGVVDPVSGHLFLLSHQFNQMVELNAATGAEIARVNVPFNVQSYAGMALDPVDGNFWIGSYSNIGELVKVNRAGVELRRADISGQGLNSNQITGLAFAPDGSLRIATIAGLIHRATLGDDFSVKAPTLTGLAGSALQGTPAQAAVASANVGQVVELAGSNFGPGTQVLFNVRDNAGVLSVLAVRPQLINTAGTRLQVLVPDQAASGDVRVSNIGTANAGFGSQNDAVHRALTFTFTAAGATSTVRFADGGLEAIDNESWGLDNVVVRNGATVVFADDFEGGASAAWSDPLVNSNSAQSLSAFSGRFNNGSQTLSLAGLTAGQSYTVSFDLYALDTWDGSAGNPDQLSVAVDGTTVFSRTISNSLLSAQTVNATPGIRLQVVPTLAAVVGRPGQDDLFTLQGSGYMEGATTVTVGGIAVTDPGSNTYPFDVSGARNDSVNVAAPRTLDGPIRVTTDGGYAELAAPSFGAALPATFTAITAVSARGQVADAAVASANSGQTIVLSGQGYTASTLVQFQAVDDSGRLGTVTRSGTASADGRELAVRVPALARSGAVSVLGASGSIALQVVPQVRAVSGTVAAGNTLLIEATGLAVNTLTVDIDGKAATVLGVQTVTEGSGSSALDQQLLRVLVPAGTTAGVLTVHTAGGLSTVRTSATAIVALPEQTPADAGATLATAIQTGLGGSQSVKIKAAVANGSDIDLYRVDLNAGDRLRFSLADHYYSQLRLFNASGAQLAAGYRSAGETTPFDFTAASAGAYYIGVSGYYNNSYDPNVAGSGTDGVYSGNYSLNLTRQISGTTRLSGIAASAASGTAAQAALASANTLQTITLNGSGLLAGDQVVFSTMDDNGQLAETTVAPATVAADGGSLTVAVPANATTGSVRLARDDAGVLLQIVPTLTALDTSPGGPFDGATLRLSGSGYAEGAVSVLFGNRRIDDMGRSYGIDVYNGNGELNVVVPDGAASGPIRISTVGGTSTALGATFTGISATASSGTPADPAQPSAVAGQVVQINGSGLSTGSEFIFSTIDSNGSLAELIVKPASVNAAQTQAQVKVPAGAISGSVRLAGDLNGASHRLQVVPVMTGLNVQSVAADGSTATVLIYGSGLIEGQDSSYTFGSGADAVVVTDFGNAIGPDVQQVYDPALGQYTSGAVYLTVPLSSGAFGAITIRTAGGASTSFSTGLAGITATAAKGAPADPAQASANTRQSIKLTGTGLSTDSSLLLRYTDYNGAPAMLRLHPESALANGTEATLLVPLEANGAFTLQMLGSSAQPLLQIVPTIDSFSAAGTLLGSGFVEGATQYGIPGLAVITDSATTAGPDVSYYYDAARGGYQWNGQANFSAALLPHYGTGTLTVATAGGSASLAVDTVRPGTADASTGPLADVAVDRSTGALWTLDQENPGHLLRIDPASGLAQQSIELTPAMGNQYTANYAGLQVLPQASSLAGVAVPAGSLLLFAGYPYNGSNNVAAINPATGALIAKLVLPVSYYSTAGLFDAASGHLFLLSHQLNQMVELNPATGAEIAKFNVPLNVQSYAGMAIDPVDGNFWIGSYNGAGSVVKISRTGVEIRRVELAAQGVDSNEINGLAFNADGTLRVASTRGVIYQVSLA